MKNVLMNMLFKKELKGQIDFHSKDKERAIKKERENINEEMRELKQREELLSYVFTDFQNGELVGIEKNKDEQEYLVVKETSKDKVDLFLIRKKNKHLSTTPYLQAEVYRDVLNGEIRLVLRELHAIDKGIGNGTILLQSFIRIAKYMGATKITGVMYPTAADKIGDLGRFYKDNGFDVVVNTEKVTGNFKMNLY